MDEATSLFAEHGSAAPAIIERRMGEALERGDECEALRLLDVLTDLEAIARVQAERMAGTPQA